MALVADGTDLTGAEAAGERDVAERIMHHHGVGVRTIEEVDAPTGATEQQHRLGVAIEALFGTQPQGVVHAIHREVDEANAEMAKQPVKSAAAPPPPPDAKPKPADNDDDDEFDELRERFGVPRLQAAFVNRIRGTAPDPEPDEYD